MPTDLKEPAVLQHAFELRGCCLRIGCTSLHCTSNQPSPNTPQLVVNSTWSSPGPHSSTAKLAFWSLVNRALICSTEVLDKVAEGDLAWNSFDENPV